MDPFIGEIRPFAGNYAPVDWLPCNGATLNIADYNALFALLGTTYGGDGTTNFKLPDLRGRLPIGAGARPGATAFAVGTVGGSESVTLTVAQTPAHTHAFNVTANAANSNSPASKRFANPAPQTFYATTPAAGSVVQNFAADTITKTGGNQPHENRMPTMAINYIICVNGIFPQSA